MNRPPKRQKINPHFLSSADAIKLKLRNPSDKNEGNSENFQFFKRKEREREGDL